MCWTAKSFIRGLSCSVKYYSKDNHLQAVCLYSKIKPEKGHILAWSRSPCDSTVPPGSILPWRFFSCKQEGTKVHCKREKITSRTTSELLYNDLLKSERENWNAISRRYKAMARRIKGKLEELHNKYTLSLESPRISVGENVYFEENGCIFLSKADDDKGNVHILFTAEDIGFSDAFIQRIRISPDQRYLATSLKSEHSEEATCVIIKLGGFPTVEEVIPNVFSFDFLWTYTAQKTGVFSLSTATARQPQKFGWLTANIPLSCLFLYKPEQKGSFTTLSTEAMSYIFLLHTENLQNIS